MEEIKSLYDESLEVITSETTLSMSKVPNYLLDAWIVGVGNSPQYDEQRDFIINIFNEVYEGYKESQNINDDNDREEYRLHFEKLLLSEKQRRLSGSEVTDDAILFDLGGYF
ncbi:MAG: hypothetical protein SNG38_03210 [Rikenellaceae bacterium]